MSKWGLFAVVLLAACSGKKEEAQKRAPIIREEELPANEPVQPAEPAVAADPLPPEDPPVAKPDPKSECIEQGELVSYDPVKLRACFDTNTDGDADRCVTWRRDGKLQSIDNTFAVEESDAKPEVTPPVEYRSDTENNDDERISLDVSAIDICPYDRSCMRIMPRLDGGEISHVLTDPDYKRAVIVVDGGDGKGIFEMWDLGAGRLRSRLQLRRLLADTDYDFSAHLGSAAVFAIASDENSHALGSIFGIDGGFRGELAQGSRNLDADLSFTQSGVFGIVDVGPVDSEQPWVLYLHSTASGGPLGKFQIKRLGHAELGLTPLSNGFAGAMQWGDDQLRIDMIDLRARTNRVLLAPSC
jgi:hypothetical protein